MSIILRSTYVPVGALVGVASSTWLAVISARYIMVQADLGRETKEALILPMLDLATAAVVLGFVLLAFACLYSRSPRLVRWLGAAFMAILCWLQCRCWGEILSLAWALFDYD